MKFSKIHSYFSFYKLNKSPAEGKGARPSVTEGNLDKSGMLITCAFSSLK